MLILNFKIAGRPSIFIATNSWPVFLRRCHHDATFVQLKSTGRTKQQQYQSQWNSNRITEKGQNRFIHLERRFRSKLQNISGFFTSFKFTYCLPSKYFMSHSVIPIPAIFWNIHTTFPFSSKQVGVGRSYWPLPKNSSLTSRPLEVTDKHTANMNIEQ